MKNLFTLFMLMFLSKYSFSQDIIENRNGEKLQVKIIIVAETYIKYKEYDNIDGPSRNISLKDVKRIKYEDGTEEEFNEEGLSTDNEKRAEREERYKEDLPEDLKPLITAGFYFDVMPCYLTTTSSWGSKYRYGGLNFRVGNKWYFGSSTRFRTGIEATWLRFGLFVDDIDDIGSIGDPDEGYFSPLNVGWTNIIRIGENSGFEITGIVGPIIEAFKIENSDDMALIYGANLKYRFIRLAVGIDYSRTAYGSNRPKSMFSLSIGGKF